MVSNKSSDESKIIAALLHDVYDVCGLVSNTRCLTLTRKKVEKRLRSEGLGFLTKTLPRLGKAFDKAIAGCTPLNSIQLGFESLPGSKLPRFLGELFSKVLSTDGELLKNPDATCVAAIRQILYLFYKYELPYSDEQEQQVVAKFERTEQELTTHSAFIQQMVEGLESSYKTCSWDSKIPWQVNVTREARRLLEEVFLEFDARNITPRHGPGAVATKQKLWDKFRWTNVSSRITEYYPFDEYFCSSMGAVCDRWRSFEKITDKDLPARVILVPKDSRGPRLISCEPVDYQWVQQGLGRAIVQLVERHYLTKYNVHFTDQTPNRIGALFGSSNGRYSTLDLNEASDRVSDGLVHLLFPEHVYTYMRACRSSSTVLPDGKLLPLQKFAPMGSALCFPTLALTVWALLTAGTTDTYTRERILVYGDDVIVPTAYAAAAMSILESFGLKINRDKSCTAGLFRESCGMDAFNGVNVTPVRFRTVWSSEPSPSVYSSWISYANSFYDRRYFRTYDFVVSRLLTLYRAIPSDDMLLTCPSLRSVPDDAKPKRRRFNKNLQKFEYYVTDLKSVSCTKDIDGWSMLLRYFTEGCGPAVQYPETIHHTNRVDPLQEKAPFSASRYTSRDTSMLVKRWR